jgi:two-component system chemotaxis response regulator CheY
MQEGLERPVSAFRRRLAAMGLEVREDPGGRCLFVRLPLRSALFESLGPPTRGEHVVFVTVGANRIKCLAPRPLFYLPLISVADCEDAAALEGRIRSTWSRRIEQLRQAWRWLEKLGRVPDPPGSEPILTVDVGLGLSPGARAAVVEPGALLLPSSGPLSGIPLRRPDDRLFRPPADTHSPIELELAATARVEELARLDARLARLERLRAQRHGPPSSLEPRSRRYRVLLVGPRLLGDTALVESLRLRGCRVTAVRGADEALAAFHRRSFELVLVESHLGRFEGLELIPSLRTLPGVEEIPIVVVDTRLRPEVRETARRVGAAAYVTHPIDVPLIEDGLWRLIETPRRRRFTRYARRVGVQAATTTRAEVATELGRGGMLLVSDRDLPVHALERFQLSLPDGRGSLSVDAEVVYRRRAPDELRTHLGLRFDGFPDNDEERLVAWIASLERGGQDPR